MIATYVLASVVLILAAALGLTALKYVKLAKKISES